MIGLETIRRDFIAMLGTFLCNRSETVADFNTLDCIDAHHRSSDFSVEFFKKRIAKTDGHFGRHDIDFRADGIARFAQGVHLFLERTQQGAGIRRRKE